jgi:hypothetical protein
MIKHAETPRSDAQPAATGASEQSASRVRWAFGCALPLLVLAALFWFAKPGTGLPLDDAWIHQVVGRTFAATGTLGYSPGHHGAAATSYLWAAILAFNFRVLHIDPALFAFAVNAALLLGSAHCLRVLLIRERPADVSTTTWEVTVFFCALLASSGGNALFYAHSGMEANLVLALVLGGACAATTRILGPAMSIATGLLGGLLALARPEAIPFGALLAFLRFRQDRRVVTLISVLAPWLACVALYFGSNLLMMGQLAPQTLSGRRWMWFDGTAGIPKLAVALDLFGTWLSRLQEFTFGLNSEAAFAISVGLSGYGIWRIVRRGSAGFRAVFVFAVFHLAFYLVLMPSPGHGGRYQPFVPFLYGAGLGFGIQGVMRWLVTKFPVLLRREAQLVAFGSSIFVATFAIAISDWNYMFRMAVQHIRVTELAMGAAINKLPAGAVVASFDIGGTGFVANRPIVDAGGLSDPAMAKQLMEGRIWEELHARNVEYLVLPLSYEEDLPHPTNFAYRLRLAENPAIKLEAITRFTSPPSVWIPSIRSTWNSSPTQVLYHVTYTINHRPIVPVQGAPAAMLRDELGVVDWRDHAITNHSLSMLAASHVDLRVLISGAPPTALRPGSVALGPWGVRTAAPAGVDAGAYAQIVEPLVRPYVALGDFGDGARMAVHGAARAQRRLVDSTCYPPLPPVPEPYRRHRIAPLGLLQIIAFGLPSLVIVALVIRRLSKRRQQDPQVKS